ncbi:hypothetical protein [Algibacter sp.]|uniref:hypothetical protein n=1 Tax=Algibacter sp. TaxID=1872428 RepID=UPI003C758FD9
MRNLISLTILLSSFLIFSQNTPCSNFKTGEFKYSNPIYSEWSITRTDSVQIEINSKSGIQIYSLIEWTNDCEYVLTCTNAQNTNPNNFIGKVFIVTFTNTFSDGYNCISKSTDPQIKSLELEIIKVK